MSGSLYGYYTRHGMHPVAAQEVGPPTAARRVLIATQGSVFKDRLGRRVHRCQGTRQQSADVHAGQFRGIPPAQVLRGLVGEKDPPAVVEHQYGIERGVQNPVQIAVWHGLEYPCCAAGQVYGYSAAAARRRRRCRRHQAASSASV